MRKLILITILWFAIESNIRAQSADSSVNKTSYPVDEGIHYKGGDDRYIEFLYKTLNYPERALKENISGTVIVYFDIDTNGRSTNLQVIKGVSKDLDNEAMRVLDMLNEWDTSQVKNKKLVYHHIVGVKFAFN